MANQQQDGSILEAVDPSGTPVRITYEVEAVDGDVVTFTETTRNGAGAPLRVDRCSLRFLDVEGLDGVLEGAGFHVEDRYGGWHREPFAANTPEIVTVARRAVAPGGSREAVE